MVRCKAIVKVCGEFDWDWGYQIIEEQCTNEKNHVGDHLIVVKNDIVSFPP
jgi:hypothetical protein